MTNTNFLSNIFWQNNIKNKAKVIFSKGKKLNIEKKISISSLNSFSKVSNDNSFSKFSIISSVFSLLLNKYFENYCGTIKIYPSNTIDLENFLLLEIKHISTTFKELLQNTVVEVKKKFSHKDYNSHEVKLELFSNFSIQFGKRNQISNDDLSLLYEESENNMIFTVFYDENYDSYTIESLLRNLINILSNYEDFLNIKIKEYSLINENEYDNLIYNFNNTSTDYPIDKTIIQLFEEQVDKTPDNIAVICEDEKLTYRQLNQQANQLANYIKVNYSVSPQKIIATLLPKSIDLLISLLAIEKLGCIYLPIDINYPKDRIDSILEDSKSKILLSKKDYIQTLGIPQSYISLECDKIQISSGDNLNLTVKPEDVAYIIYTSGSTGKPKGVLIEHHSNINMSLDQIKIFGITSEDKIVWFASVAFDASISEIMMSLYSGATLCIPAEAEQKDRNKFALFLEKTESTVVTFPPSYLELLTIQNLRTLKTIITAGEPANPIKAREITENKMNFYNAYGPTEYSVCASIYKLEDSSNFTIIPIGRPIANTQIYILDEHLNPVPIGVLGSIFISGEGLSRGYLNNAQLTEEKFIDNPFLSNTKMYDTGDLGRWNKKNEIEFLGRKDFQVKIRGYRIELGEIEAHILLSAPHIRQVVADAVESKGEKTIVVYYTTDKSNHVDKSNIREYLFSKIPEYMIPGFFVELDTIPLTPNGKINRKALPKVTDEDIIRNEYVAPKNETEQKLVEIWQKVLNVDKIGVTDNFFDVGGTSIKAIKVINEINNQFNTELTVTQLFKNYNILNVIKKIDDVEYLNLKKITL